MGNQENVCIWGGLFYMWASTFIFENIYPQKFSSLINKVFEIFPIIAFVLFVIHIINLVTCVSYVVLTNDYYITGCANVIFCGVGFAKFLSKIKEISE